MPNWLSRQRGTEETSLATTSGNSSEAEEHYLGTSARTVRGLHLRALFLGEKSAVRPRRRPWSTDCCCRKSRGSNTEGLWHYRSISGSTRRLAGFVPASGATESNERQSVLNSEFLQGRTVSPCTSPSRRGLQWVRGTTLRTGLRARESCGREGAAGDFSRVLTTDGLHRLLSLR